jgi:hypothetical protein
VAAGRVTKRKDNKQRNQLSIQGTRPGFGDMWDYDEAGTHILIDGEILEDLRSCFY